MSNPRFAHLCVWLGCLLGAGLLTALYIQSIWPLGVATLFSCVLLMFVDWP